MKSRISKIVCTILAGTLIITMFAGCGRSSEENWGDTSSDDSEMNEIRDEIESDDKEVFQSEQTVESINDAQETQEATEASYKKFDAVPEWKDIKPYSPTIQIDDTLYTIGCTVDEIMKKVNASSVKYTSDYTPDGIGAGNITVSRNGVEWFVIKDRDASEDGSGKRKDCIVSDIEVGTDVKPYCRFIDGRSFDDILNMTYEDARKLLETTFTETDGWTYKEMQNNGVDFELNEGHDNMLEMGYAIHPYKNANYEINNPDLIMELKEQDRLFDVYIYYGFAVDKDTTKIYDFNFSFNSGDRTKPEMVSIVGGKACIGTIENKKEMMEDQGFSEESVSTETTTETVTMSSETENTETSE